MNLHELKRQMNTVPDHKMNHDKPMRGPIRKQEIAGKMKAPSQAEAMRMRHAKAIATHGESGLRQKHEQWQSEIKALRDRHEARHAKGQQEYHAYRNGKGPMTKDAQSHYQKDTGRGWHE